MTNSGKCLFPVREISKLAEKESWRKEINRPIYHIHKWWAQRLGTVFRAILLHLAKDEKINIWNEFYKKHNFAERIVLDPFMGSGTTLGEALKLGTKVVGCDINPVSTFLVKQAFTRVSLNALQETYTIIKKMVANDILHYYKTIDKKTGDEIDVLYYFWVKIVTTPTGEDIPLFSTYVFSKNAYPNKKPIAQIICPTCWNVFSAKYNTTEEECPHCGYKFNPQEGPAKNSTVIDRSGRIYKIKDLLPKNGLLKEKMYALLGVNKCGEKVYLPIQQYDIELYKSAQKELKKTHISAPLYQIYSGHNTDQAKGYNYLYWRDFFNDRQLLCLNKLLNEIIKIQDVAIKEQMLCLFSSILEYNNMFCSFKGEGTGAVRPIFSHHILKPERTPIENSIWGYEKSSGCFSNFFKSKLLKAKKYLDEPFELQLDNNNSSKKILASEPLCPIQVSSWKSLKKSRHSALILNGDSSHLPIPKESIDWVVTDPPYFDFLHYSELSDFFYAWLSPALKDSYPFFALDTSRRKNEVQQTSAIEFTKLLGNVFGECKRVLKKDGKLAFSFHHSNFDGWIAVANAIQAAGMYIKHSFPVHAELMASTPKSNAKDPISLDAIIICEKQKQPCDLDFVQNESIRYIKEICTDGIHNISKNDILVICASQCLKFMVNNNLSNEEKSELLDKVYTQIIALVSEQPSN